MSAAVLTREVGDAPDLRSYDHVVLFTSGGKDATACLLDLLERGVDAARIELHHHEVDGRGAAFMDWPVTGAYVAAQTAAFGLPLFRSWRAGGFEREMLRQDAPTAPILFETPHGVMRTGGAGPRNTRLLFPQTSADLSVRWCSAALKIGVGAACIAGQDRFLGRRTLVVTGERAQEGAAPEDFEGLDFERFSLQPMDGPDAVENTARTIDYCLRHPQWRLSLQTHKTLGIR